VDGEVEQLAGRVNLARGLIKHRAVDTRASTSRPTQRIPSGMSARPLDVARVEAATSRRTSTPLCGGADYLRLRRSRSSMVSNATARREAAAG
jgi:hypothetical protein